MKQNTPDDLRGTVYDGSVIYNNSYPIAEQMSSLIATGRVPISVAGLMDKRLHSKRRSYWGSNPFCTGDGVAYHPDGKFKIVLDAQPLREMTADSQLEHRALVLADGVYESLEGQEFNTRDFESEGIIDLTLDEVMAHPVWQVLARDSDRLEAYVETVFGGMREGRHGKGMSFNLKTFHSQQESIVMRPWLIGTFYDKSFAWGIEDIDGYALLAGVAPDEGVKSTRKKP